MDDQTLLSKFVEHFTEDGAADPFEGDLVVRQLTDASALDPIYSVIPIKFPALLEKLLLSYRWHGADTGMFRLLANPPGSDLSVFLSQMIKDKVIHENCSKNGFVQFGWGTDFCYDPVCFDTRARERNFPIVQLDHEQILCHSRIKDVATLAKNFEELVESVLNAGSS